eukprot:m.192102 g.192102  ORF g.192102 m.192102 type:complete len:479 (+) comp15160_c0_seq2:152-1588(+)
MYTAPTHNSRGLVVVVAVALCLPLSDAVVSSRGSVPQSALHSAFAAALNRDLSTFANRNSLGIWVAIVNGSERFVVSLGTSDGGATSAGGHDILPVGSYAKPWTAVAVLRLVERGVISLNDLAEPLIDPFLKRINGTTLRELYGPNIAVLTVHDLLHMTSGLARYGDDWVHDYTLNDPHWDIGPLDYLALLKQNNETTVSCVCGSLSSSPAKCIRSPSCCIGAQQHQHCPDYNSINFLLLGLLYAGQTGASSWEEVDLKAAALKSPEKVAEYSDTEFYIRGECSSYPRTVHYYDWCGPPKQQSGCENYPIGPVDMFNRSCMNGWAFGNIGTSALDAAFFFFDLLGRRVLLNETTVAAMRTFGPGVVMDSVPYGLGIWKTFQLSIDGTPAEGIVNTSFPNISEYLVYEGHAGDDYGTISRQGWHAKLNLGFSIMVNRQFGTFPDMGTNTHGLYCHVWRLLFEVMDFGFDDAFSCPQWPN